jgi:CheY-like chemotaxis protein
VQAQSPGAGRGATFSALFPVARVTDKVAVTASTPLAAAPEASRRARHFDALADLRVLFIDDDFRTREAVLEVLQRAGARVALAASVADGMLALDTFKPQVIVCDIAMPGEDGYAFIRKLRAREGGRDASIPVLALTALASVEDKRRALAAGFQAHLAKPIDIDRLRDAVLELAKLAAQPRA